MRLRLLLFASLREAVGKKEVLLEMGGECSLREVVARAEQELPEIAKYRGRLLVTLNEEHVSLDALVRDGDEIALLPPVGGGSDRPWVQESPLSMDALLAEVQGDGMGGLVTFAGTVRNSSKGHQIDHLEYEAYLPMAEKEMRKIVAQALERWPEVRMAMSHRTGRLEIGEAAVMIAAAAPHRGAAFEACRFAIDTLKQSVPIWKKEFTEQGTYWVEENP
jgi:molybdopterin synthase catalytic subunit/molybdopterin converting factor small subunit